MTEPEQPGRPEHPFDRLSRALGAARSRRAVLRQVGAVLAGAMAASVLPRGARAAAPCAPGLVACGGGCADILSDPSNCGACGVSAGPGGSCQHGVPRPSPNASAQQPPSDQSASNPPTMPPNLNLPPAITPPPPTVTKTCANFGEYCDGNTPCCAPAAILGLLHEGRTGLVCNSGISNPSLTNTCTCATYDGFTTCGNGCCNPDQCCRDISDTGRLECVTGSNCGDVCRCAATGVKACYAPGTNFAQCCRPGELCNEQGHCGCHTGQVSCQINGSDPRAPLVCCPPGYTCPSSGTSPQGRCCTPSERPCALICCPAEASCFNDGLVDGCKCPDQRVECNLLTNGVCCPIGADCVGSACVCRTGQPVCGTGAKAACCGATQCCSNGICVNTCPTSQCCTGGVCQPGAGCGPSGTCCPASQCCNKGVCQPGEACGPSGTCCPTGQACVGGACQCAFDAVVCGTICCPSGQCCNNGACMTGNRCGAAGVCCPPGTCCVNGVCTAGVACGTSGLCCQNGQQCVSGQCVCPSGQFTCNGVCCQPGQCCLNGACSASCPAPLTCSAGVCQCAAATISCFNSVGVITGCCTSTQTCQNGQCLSACSATSPCRAGACCANGICVANCPADSCCASGLCVPAAQCPNGGCCTNGVCGCVSPATCQNGMCLTGGGLCQQPCPPGQCWDNGFRRCLSSCGASAVCCGGLCCDATYRVCTGSQCIPKPPYVPCGACGLCDGSKAFCCPAPGGLGGGCCARGIGELCCPDGSCCLAATGNCAGCV